MLKVAINGFGRIGRLALRVGLKKHKDEIEFVAINTSGRIDTAGWAHLFEYDTVYGKYEGEVKAEGDPGVAPGQVLVVGGVKIPVLAELDPKKLPWKKYEVDLVLECTGKFRKPEEADDHLEAGAKKVLLSAPPKGGDVGIYMMGVNEEKLKDDKIFSNASCTTNCVGPVAKVMVQEFGVLKATMTTIHAYTSDQRLLDNSHKDLRRARSAGLNIIPTITGAATATGKVVSELDGLFDGVSIRVPIAIGSLVDFTFLVKKKVSVEEVNQAMKKAANGDMKGILGVTDKPVVSSDVIGSEFSSVVDLGLTKVIDGDLVKVFSWYDNEWGYVVRMMELAIQ